MGCKSGPEYKDMGKMKKLGLGIRKGWAWWCFGVGLKRASAGKRDWGHFSSVTLQRQSVKSLRDCTTHMSLQELEEEEEEEGEEECFSLDSKYLFATHMSLNYEEEVEQWFSLDSSTLEFNAVSFGCIYIHLADNRLSFATQLHKYWQDRAITTKNHASSILHDNLLHGSSWWCTNIDQHIGAIEIKLFDDLGFKFFKMNVNKMEQRSVIFCISRIFQHFLCPAPEI